jgi:hypothetical protein
MPEGIVQFEVELTSFSSMRSRIVWPDATGPWIEGGLEELMVHFTYASWSSYVMGYAISLALASQDETLGQTVSDILTHTVEAMGAVQLGEIRMNRDALDELRDGRTEP